MTPEKTEKPKPKKLSRMQRIHRMRKIVSVRKYHQGLAQERAQNQQSPLFFTGKKPKSALMKGR